jgi:hypothetical protein
MIHFSGGQSNGQFHICNIRLQSSALLAGLVELGLKAQGE